MSPIRLDSPGYHQERNLRTCHAFIKPLLSKQSRLANVSAAEIIFIHQFSVLLQVKAVRALRSTSRTFPAETEYPLCPPLLNATCKCFTGWLKYLFPTSGSCPQSICLARIPVFCVSICCCLLSCSGPEELLRVGKAANRVVSSLLSLVSEQDGRLPSDLHLLPKRLQVLL